jgi:hypothetical protein
MPHGRHLSLGIVSLTQHSCRFESFDRQPMNHKDAVSLEDKLERAEEYEKEYRELMEQNAFNVIRPEKGIKIHDTLTRLGYKKDNRTFLKPSMCKRGSASAR